MDDILQHSSIGSDNGLAPILIVLPTRICVTRAQWVIIVHGKQNSKIEMDCRDVPHYISPNGLSGILLCSVHFKIRRRFAISATWLHFISNSNYAAQISPCKHHLSNCDLAKPPLCSTDCSIDNLELTQLQDTFMCMPWRTSATNDIVIQEP